MKNKITIIALWCILCLILSACNINITDKNNQSDSTETNNMTDSSNEEIDSQDIKNKTTEPYDIEIPLLTLESMDMYTEFLNSNEMPDDFVLYDEISDVGDFEILIFLCNAYSHDYSSYLYGLVDSEGFEISLYVEHNTDEFSLETDSIIQVNKTNMSLLTDTSDGDYIHDNIKYTYVSGELFSISWKTQNITYILCKGGYPMFSDYPPTTSTFVGKMLNLDTATQALNDIFKDK